MERRRKIVPDKDWVPEEAFALLQCERMVQPDLTDEELARQILMSAAPQAAQSLAWMSVHASNERIRLAASKYIIDGVVGGGFKSEGGTDDVLVALLNRLALNDKTELE